MNLFLWIRHQHWPQCPGDLDPTCYERIIEKLSPYYHDQFALETAFDKRGIDFIAAETGLSPEEITLVLAGTLGETGSKLTQNWIAKHWPDFIVGILLAFFIALFVLGQRAAEKKNLDKASSKHKPQVVAARNLPAFTPISADGLRGEGFKNDKDKDQSIGEIIGRYPTELIKSGQPIGTGHGKLSEKKTTLINHSILRVSLKSTVSGKVPFFLSQPHFCYLLGMLLPVARYFPFNS